MKGETPYTLKETLSFITKNFYGIDSTLWSAVFAVHGSPLLNEFSYYEKKYGAKLITNGYWGKVHVYPCKLSKFFEFEEICHLCNILEKIFSSEEGWYMSEVYHYAQEDGEKLKEKLIKGRFQA